MKLKGRDVLVMGLGRSGLAAMRLCAQRGACVTATDRRTAAELPEVVAEAERNGSHLVLGQHRTDDFLAADLVVLSPGIPLEQPHVAAAAAAGVPVIGELELACSQLACPIVGITGTNGKSTTTTFAGDLLTATGLHTFVGGNLGVPLSEGVLEAPFDLAVVEVSSFQLETAPSFHPTVAALLNVTEDHLDRYPGFEAYCDAKAQIFANLGPEDAVVHNAADPIVDRLVADLPGRRLAFSLEDHGADGAFLAGGELRLRLDGVVHPLDTASFAVPGSHNTENLMAALLCGIAAGAPFDGMARSLSGLRGLPHRMEWVGSVHGVDWYNDSKATNVASAAKTLEGCPAAAVMLLGGKDKGGDYAPLVRLLGARARGVVVYGQAAAVISAALDAGGVAYRRVEDLAGAVQAACAMARPGDAVLLSPACSSYDQFRDYEQRGDTFRALVEDLG
jgi:UDP-N-acetylmuramoylalanine--D-glutamate ligase